ncbi:MAG: ferritin [bacterium]|nr:ferritin [bacterium]
MDTPIMPERSRANEQTSEVLAALNDQLANELFANHIYHAMQAYFLYHNLPGLAHWMEVQAAEEDTHARRIFDFIIERGWKVTIKAVPEPPHDWDSPTAAFQAAYDHEHGFTEIFHEIYRKAEAAGDIATRIFLQWFITEQVEEEAVASEALAKMKMVESSPAGLYMLDRELGSRRGDTGAQAAGG